MLWPDRPRGAKPVGPTYVAPAYDSGSEVRNFLFSDDRLLNKERAAQTALDMVRGRVLGKSREELKIQ